MQETNIQVLFADPIDDFWEQVSRFASYGMIHVYSLQSLSVVLYAAHLAEVNSGGDGISDFLFKSQPPPPFAGKLARNLVMVKCVRKPGSILRAAVTCVVFCSVRDLSLA